MGNLPKEIKKLRIVSIMFCLSLPDPEPLLTKLLMRNPDPQHHLLKKIDHTKRLIKPLYWVMLITSKKGVTVLCGRIWSNNEMSSSFLQQTGSGQQLTRARVFRLAGEVENLVQFHPGVRKKNISASILIFFATKKRNRQLRERTVPKCGVQCIVCNV